MKPTSSSGPRREAGEIEETGEVADPGEVRALTLSTFLPYRLSVASAVVSDGLARLYTERFGIGIPEWRVLATVGEFRSTTAKAIGAHARMGKVKVSRAAASLEARGLIRRIPNAEDLREAFLVLTPAGEATYGEIAPLALDYADALAAALTADERAALAGILDKLVGLAREGARDEEGARGPGTRPPHAPQAGLGGRKESAAETDPILS